MNGKTLSSKIGSLAFWLLFVGCLMMFVMATVQIFDRMQSTRLISQTVQKSETPDSPMQDGPSSATSINEDNPVGFASAIPVFDTEFGSLEPVTFLAERPRGRVLIVRGILTVFSLGLNKLGKDLQKAGYDVYLTPAIHSSATAGKMSRKHLAERVDIPLIIIGHSLGADLAPTLAESFASSKIPIDLLVMLDSTMPTTPPKNVKKCVNLFQSDSSSVFHGRRIQSSSPDTKIYNINVLKLAPPQATSNMNHFNIDANPWVHEWIVKAVEHETYMRSKKMQNVPQRIQETQHNRSSNLFRRSDVGITIGDSPPK